MIHLTTFTEKTLHYLESVIICPKFNQKSIRAFSMKINSNTLVYDSSQLGIPSITEIKEAYRYRNFIFQLARRDILTRYKRSFLGITWTMLNPLGMMLVLTLAFSQINKDIKGYPAYVLTGLLAWTFFSQTTTASMVNLVWGGGLLNKVYVPKTSFAIAAIITGIINACLTLVPLIIVMAVTGVALHPSIIFFPIALIILASFSLGIGLLLSTFAVYFPDVAEMYQIVLQAWFFLTPVVINEKQYPSGYSYWIFHLNPMFYMIRIFRVTIYDGRFPYLSEFTTALVVGLVALLIGFYVFTRKANEFGYRI